ncbi:MAG: ECF-type sigma factor [Planctomycetota bacterium]
MSTPEDEIVPAPNEEERTSAEPDPNATGSELGDVFDALHGQLRDVAARVLAHQPPGHSLQPTALVHEAFLKLHSGKWANWTDDAHLVAVAAMAMRQILVDHERSKRAERRPPIDRKLPLDSIVLGYEVRGLELLALDEALDDLRSFDQTMAAVVECRYFLGLSIPEIAERFGIPSRTLHRRWHATSAWLRGRLG